jgi:hypothetical protein
VSEVQPKSVTFFDLYSQGQVTADQIDDFVEAWHESDDSEHRSLSQYLGMTDDEYAVWLASHRALPLLAAARRDGLPVTEVVTRHLVDLRSMAPTTGATAIHVLTNWLKKRMAP